MTFQPGDIVEYVRGYLSGQHRTVLRVEGERLHFTNGAWSASVDNLELVTPATPALVPKYAVGDEVMNQVGVKRMIREVYIAYKTTVGPAYREDDLSPVCSHTHTTCDECHEQLTKEK
jgi:hypothetical protein